MSIVKVKTKGQVTLPFRIREQAGLSIGDMLEANFSSGKITLTPKSMVDKRIATHLAESMADLKAGRSYGPFDTAEGMIADMEKRIKKLKKKK